MRKVIGPILFLLLAAEVTVAVLIVMAQPGGFSSIVDVSIGPERRQTIQNTFDTNGTGNLIVENDNGKIEVIGLTTTNQVSIKATKVVHGTSDEEFNKLQFEANQNGNDIVVKAHRSGSGINWGNYTEISITAPASLVANLQTSNGQISLSNMENPIATHRISTDNGRVEVNQVKAAKVQLHTSNGELNMNGLNATLNAETSNGRIVANNSNLSIEQVKTSNGSIELRGTLTQTANGNIETNNGSIKVGFEQAGQVRFEATTDLGSIDFNRNMGGFQLQEKHHVITNGTGPTLRLKTNLGSITVD